MADTGPFQDEPAEAGSRLGRLLLGGGAFALLATGLVLWWREGDRLFTDGMIAAIARCF